MSSRREWIDVLKSLPMTASATVWRRMLRRPRVIGITGSVGKTTTKDFLTAILATRLRVASTSGSSNGRTGVPRIVLRTRPGDDYTIAEVGIRNRGRMWRAALLLRPDIAIITRVARVHVDDIGDLEAIAREKAILMRNLPPSGFAVLNGDDPRVVAMAKGLPCPVYYFGTSPSMDVWADEISCTWPGRLSLRVHAGNESCFLQTRFIGKHWTLSVMAAIAAAIPCGFTLADCCAAIAGVEPYVSRLEPVELSNGAQILVDDYNASIDTWEPALDVLRTAGATRKIIVTSGVSDHPEKLATAMKDLGRRIAGAADMAVFLHEHREAARDAALEAGISEAHACETLEQASEILRLSLRPGDLVLIKGFWFHHLTRLQFALRGQVACRKKLCLLTLTCVRCSELGFRPGETGPVGFTTIQGAPPA